MLLFWDLGFLLGVVERRRREYLERLGFGLWCAGIREGDEVVGSAG